MPPKKKNRSSQMGNQKGPITSYGAPADPVTVKTNINLNSIAKQAAKRKTSNLYSEDPVKLKEEKIKNFKNNVYKQLNNNSIKIENLEAKDNDFVYYNGVSYKGLYHIHSDNSFMTEATHIPGISKFIMKKTLYQQNPSMAASFYKLYREAVPELVDPSR